jgi:hypothetical protein
MRLHIKRSLSDALTLITFIKDANQMHAHQIVSVYFNFTAKKKK